MGVDRSPTLDELDFDPTGFSNYEGTESNARELFETIGNNTLETSSSYNNAFDPSTSISTSLAYVNKLQISTGEPLPRGYYIAHFTGDIANSRSGKRTGFKVNWREDGVTGFAIIHESTAGIGSANTFETRSGFSEIPVTGGNTVTFQFQFSFTENGSTVSLKNVGFYLFKVRELP